MFHGMGASSKRIWNSTRMLRKKECSKAQQSLSKPEGSAQTVAAYDAEDDESQDNELQTRVLEWLKDSKSIHNPSDSMSNLRSKSDCLPQKYSDNCILYHPDFTDWALVEQEDTEALFNSTRAKLSNLFDDATASISNMLRIPFSV
jgi:hypothetical protein